MIPNLNLIKAGSGKYHVRFTDIWGVRHSRSLGTARYTRARKRLHSQEVKAAICALSAGPMLQVALPALGAEEAVEAFVEWILTAARSRRTAETYIYFVRAWCRERQLKHIPINAVGASSLNAWLNDSGNKLASRIVMLAALRKFFHFCSGNGWCVGDPSKLAFVDYAQIPHEKKETKIRQPFTHLEVANLLATSTPTSVYPDPFWHIAIAIGRYAGLRLGDIAQLEWQCLSQPGKLIVWTDKKNRRVELPIEPEKLVAAIGMIPPKDPRYCFPKQRLIAVDLVRRAGLSGDFTRLMDRAGVDPGKCFHCLRHTYLTWLVNEAGLSREEAARRAGHISTRTTDVYIQRAPVCAKQLRDVISANDKLTDAGRKTL